MNDNDSGMAPETLARIEGRRGEPRLTSELLERVHRTLTQPSPYADLLERATARDRGFDPEPARFEFDQNMREWMGVDPADPGGQPDPAPVPTPTPLWVDAPYVVNEWVPTAEDREAMRLQKIGIGKQVDAKPKRLSWWANE